MISCSYLICFYSTFNIQCNKQVVLLLEPFYYVDVALYLGGMLVVDVPDKGGRIDDAMGQLRFRCLAQRAFLFQNLVNEEFERTGWEGSGC